MLPLLRIWGVFNIYQTHLVVLCHFGPFLAVFEAPWALECPKHLYEQPELEIYPLVGDSAQKTTFILNSFHFFFFGMVFLWSIFHLTGPIFDPWRGLKLFKVCPYPAWPRVPSSNCEISPKTELVYWFCWVLLIFSRLKSILLILLTFGVNKATLSEGSSPWGPHGDSRRC